MAQSNPDTDPVNPSLPPRGAVVQPRTHLWVFTRAGVASGSPYIAVNPDQLLYAAPAGHDTVVLTMANGAEFVVHGTLNTFADTDRPANSPVDFSPDYVPLPPGPVVPGEPPVVASGVSAGIPMAGQSGKVPPGQLPKGK